MKKYPQRTLVALLSTVLMAGVSYADNGSSPNDFAASLQGVVTALQTVNESVQKIPQELSPQFQSINNTQVAGWNKFLQLQADQQFSTTPGADGQNHSMYSTINDQLYSPARQFQQAATQVFQQSLGLVTYVENKQLERSVCLTEGKDFLKDSNGNIEVDSKGQPIDKCLYDASGNLYADDIAFLGQNQYSNDPDSKSGTVVFNQVADLLSPLLANKRLSTAVTSIPVSVIAEIQASRTPVAQMQDDKIVYTPSLMAVLENAVTIPLSESWQNSMAQASLLDVVRAQNALLAVNNYLQYQRLKSEQQTQALLVALMAENAALSQK